MNSDVKLSIIIVTYNNESTINDCINSIHKYNDIGVELEVIVVDNCSTDGTIQLLKILEDERKIKYVIAKENKGFGAGNNIGVNNSTGKYLFFLNPDTILTEPIFKLVCTKLEKGVPVCGFHLITPAGNDMPSFSPMPEDLHFFHFLKIKYFFLKYIDLKLKNYFPWGASLALSRELFFNVGLFDENYFLNFEEPDLIHRIKPKYIVILKNKIIHLESISKPKGPKSIQYYEDSKNYYFSKYEELHSAKIRIVLNIKNKIKSFLKR